VLREPGACQIHEYGGQALDVEKAVRDRVAVDDVSFEIANRRTADRVVRTGHGYKSAGRTVNTPPCGGFTARKCL
jgi:hypothetical protein